MLHPRLGEEPFSGQVRHPGLSITEAFEGTATAAGIAAGSSSSSGLLAATGANPMLAAGALVLLVVRR